MQFSHSCRTAPIATSRETPSPPELRWWKPHKFSLFGRPHTAREIRGGRTRRTQRQAMNRHSRDNQRHYLLIIMCSWGISGNFVMMKLAKNIELYPGWSADDEDAGTPGWVAEYPLSFLLSRLVFFFFANSLWAHHNHHQTLGHLRFKPTLKKSRKNTQRRRKSPKWTWEHWMSSYRNLLGLLIVRWSARERFASCVFIVCGRMFMNESMNAWMAKRLKFTSAQSIRVSEGYCRVFSWNPGCSRGVRRRRSLRPWQQVY